MIRFFCVDTANKRGGLLQLTSFFIVWYLIYSRYLRPLRAYEYRRFIRRGEKFDRIRQRAP